MIRIRAIPSALPVSINISGTFAEFMARPFAEFQKSDFQRRDTFPSSRRMKSGFVVSPELTKFSRNLPSRGNIQTQSRTSRVFHMPASVRIDSTMRYMVTTSREEYRLDGEYYADPSYVRNTILVRERGIKIRIETDVSFFFVIRIYVNFLEINI